MEGDWEKAIKSVHILCSAESLLLHQEVRIIGYWFKSTVILAISFFLAPYITVNNKSDFWDRTLKKKIFPIISEVTILSVLYQPQLVHSYCLPSLVSFLLLTPFNFNASVLGSQLPFSGETSYCFVLICFMFYSLGIDFITSVSVY